MRITKKKAELCKLLRNHHQGVPSMQNALVCIKKNEYQNYNGGKRKIQ